MMNRRQSPTFRLGAACLLTLAASPAALAQSGATGAAAQPRSQNERITTEGVTPSTINRQIQKDEAAAEASRGRAIAPAIPPGAVGSSSVPAPAPLPADPNAPGVAPAAGTVPAADSVILRNPGTPGQGMMGARPALMPGLDVAMLIEHAVGMAIEGSALQAIAGPQASAGGPTKELSDHGRAALQESRDLLTRAASDGRNVPANSPIRRFYDASNAYITALSAMSAASPAPPAELARVALINHAVKEVLDANHIAAMGRTYGGSGATEQLVQHARAMKEAGTQSIMRMVGNAGAEADQPGPAMLARHGRDLIEAADQIAASAPAPVSMRGQLPSNTPNVTNGVPDIANDRPVRAIPGGLPNNGEAVNSPGRFQDPRPEIIGGTYSTGSPSVGTVNNAGVKEALREAATTPNPDPNPALPNTPNTLGPNGNPVPAGTTGERPISGGVTSPR
ncbi:hypothetical protein TA3x_002778 [Tundrisphaera sp. TA3]|uniref:hypothetical protein n=1 Tax=Tundrisphaera sp. TA3 TaxID=3435775 RepID=UPI003EBE63BA